LVRKEKTFIVSRKAPFVALSIKEIFMGGNLMPVVSIIAGILILVYPRILNYIVAIYLILTGLMGFMGS
jgi:hypothetical protein